jgi:hypothetical protein
VISDVGKPVLFTIPGINIPIYENGDGSYSFTGTGNIDGDGSGPSHGDPDYQPSTSLKQDGLPLNADVDIYFVLPEEVINLVAPIVLGCKGLIEDEINGLVTCAVVGDEGPKTRAGEMSIAAANAIKVPSSPTTGGDQRRACRFTFWPGIPAVVNGKQYFLQAS